MNNVRDSLELCVRRKKKNKKRREKEETSYGAYIYISLIVFVSKYRKKCANV